VRPRRSPESRAAVYAAIEDYCRRFPDMRLGQVIGNALGHAGLNGDPYYVEDDDLGAMIEKAEKVGAS
jgi:hypothetical protein